MRILIAGAQGKLGSDLVETFSAGHRVLGLGKAQLDISDPEQCEARVAEFRPQVVFNSAAYTQVDACESNEALATRVNGEGPANLAAAALKCAALFVHYSTDYIFDGNRHTPYSETDPPNPQTAYGRTKLLGEERTRATCANHLILRTAWIFGRNGKNFIRTILTAARQRPQLRVVNDQTGSPSYTRDLAAHTRRLVEAGCRGTYHLTNSGTCTWYELAVAAIEWAGITGVQVIPVTTAEYPLPARRPAYSVLGNGRLEREGIPPMRHWKEAAREYVQTYLR